MGIGTLWKIRSEDETKIPEMENFFLGELGFLVLFHEAIAESVFSLSFGQRGLLMGGESGRTWVSRVDKSE